MRKKTILVLAMFLISFVIIFAFVPIAKYLHYYFMFDEYDPKYEKIWVSEDSNLTITIDNIREMYGVGRYEGIYEFNGERYDLEIVIDSISYAEMINGDEVFSGRGYHNIFTDSYTIYVDEVESKYSIYNPGDKIVFRRE